MSERDPAAGRWAVIQAVRIAGLAIALIGLLHQAGRFPPFGGVPAWVGYGLLAIGLFEVFYLPILLARRWKSQPPRDDARDAE